MALKIFDGFDHYATQADLQARVGALQWSDIYTASPVSFVAGRGGYGYAAVITGSSLGPAQIGGSFNANYSTAFEGIAVQIQPVGCSYCDVQAMDYTGNSAQLTFRCAIDSGIIYVYLGDPNAPGSTPLYTSPQNAFSPFIWNKFEIGGTYGSSGSFDFHVNGNSVAALSGLNTSYTGNNWVNGIRVRMSPIGSGTQACAYVDDFNLNDGTTGPGTYPLNGFIGDCATRTLFTAANSSVQWTPLANTNHVEVGEYQFDRDASYNYATTVGNTDLFTFGSLPTTTSAVFGVQLTGGYRKQDASAQTIVNVFSSSGTVLSGNAWALSLDWAFYTDLSALDPHTSATWTPAAVNALIGGYKLNS